MKVSQRFVVTLLIFDLVAVHVVDFEEDLRIGDFHIAEAIKHLTNTLEALLIGHCSSAIAEQCFNLLQRVLMLLHNERSSHLCTILVAQMCETS